MREDEDQALYAEIFAEHAAREVKRMMANSALVTPKKAARKQREKKARAMVDGRSLRAKGRSAQVNIKVRPEVKERLLQFAEAEGVLIADWFEQLVEDLPIGGAA
jgi:hypothetical protein